MIYTVDAQALCRAYISGANKLCNNKNILNELNVFPVPDGDTGSNMSMTVRAATNELLEKKFDTVGEVMSIIAGASLRGARGNSGVILSQFFRGISKRLKDCQITDVKDIAEAFTEGVEAAYRAVMKPTEGTMLTVARDGAAAGMKLVDTDSDIIKLIETVVAAAQISLDKTPEILPQLKQAGVVDSGGQGVVYMLEGVLSFLQNGEVIELTDTPVAVAKVLEKKETNTEIQFTYCTEFLIDKNNPKASSKLFSKNIEKKGDSMVIIDDEDIIKVHIHTNNPGYVIEEALKLGMLCNIKIDNMKFQHNSLPEQETESEPPKDYGFAAVAVGVGINEIFKDMEIDSIIEGGQTMNPSTDDILSAIEKINAKTIIVLPNNKNIILAAEQVRDLTDKNVIIIPTRSIPEGITAKLAFDPTKSPDENKTLMTDSLKFVKTGNVTYAVRNTTFQDKEIKEGNIIGISGGEIAVVGEDPFEVMKNLLGILADEDSEIISVFYGSDVSEEQAGELEVYLEENYSDCDIVVHSGGQPLYYYIISVE